jgi:glycosyltransferase involved in cell wall biosynthesis
MAGLATWLTRPFRKTAQEPPKIALSWRLSERFGWGLSGVHIALYLAERGQPPLVMTEPLWDTFRPEHRQRLAMLEGVAFQVTELIKLHEPKPVVLDDFHMLHALFNHFVAQPVSQRVRGKRNIGVVAFEDTLFDQAVLERARGYDRFVVHSSYNKRLLEERGFADVQLALQGIDETEMSPQPRRGRFGSRFVVFSGGKLEHRKGHDLVLAAFVRFHARHPDALLATAWENIWPQSALGLAASPWTPVAPQTDAAGRLRIRDWALANGVPADAFVDLGHLERAQIAPLLAECDAAVFPNRCEGGTNLVAMEAMACGLPVVLSANTGHLDIIGEDRCLILREQSPVPDDAGRTLGWGESSVDELVAHLESLYTDRVAARERARNAVSFMRAERTWRQFAQTLIEQI